MYIFLKLSFHMMYSDLDMTILAVLLESKVEKRIEIIQPKA